MSQNLYQRFITYLQSLVEKQERGALAALRRGLGQPVGQAPEMYPYIIPFLPESLHPEQEAVFYLIASLFAYHPLTTDEGNLGRHLAAIRNDRNQEALDRRFTALLAAHPDDLPAYLRQTISYLKSRDVPVNWERLLRDLSYWSHPEYGPQVRKNWANAFWGRPAGEEQTQNQTT